MPYIPSTTGSCEGPSPSTNPGALHRVRGGRRPSCHEHRVARIRRQDRRAELDPARCARRSSSGSGGRRRPRPRTRATRSRRTPPAGPVAPCARSGAAPAQPDPHGALLALDRPRRYRTARRAGSAPTATGWERVGAGVERRRERRRRHRRARHHRHGEGLRADVSRLRRRRGAARSTTPASRSPTWTVSSSTPVSAAGSGSISRRSSASTTSHC